MTGRKNRETRKRNRVAIRLWVEMENILNRVAFWVYAIDDGRVSMWRASSRDGANVIAGQLKTGGARHVGTTTREVAIDELVRMFEARRLVVAKINGVKYATA